MRVAVLGHAPRYLSELDRARLRRFVVAAGWRERPRRLGVGIETLQNALHGGRVRVDTHDRLVAALDREGAT